MRLKTIWTIPAMATAERLRRTRDLALQEVAHRMPRRLAYWSFIDSGARLIGPNEVVPEARYTDLLKRADGWVAPRG